MAAVPGVARILRDWPLGLAPFDQNQRLGAAPRSLFLLRGCVFYEARLVLPMRTENGAMKCPMNDLSCWARPLKRIP